MLKMKNKKILVSVCALIICLYTGVSIAYSPSAKEVYFNLEKNAVKTVTDSLNDFEKSEFAKLFSLNEDKTMKYTLDISSKLSGKPETTVDTLATDTINMILDKTYLKMTHEVDYKNDYQNLDGELKIYDESLNININENKEFIKVYLPELYNKYISLKTTDLTPLYKTFDIEPSENMPNKLINQKDLLNAVKLNKSEEKQLLSSLKNYEKILKNNLKDSNFKQEKNVVLEYNNKTMKADKITLTLSVNDIERILEAVTKELKNDKSLDILTKKVYDVLKIYLEAGYYSESEMPSQQEMKELVVSSLENVLNDMKMLTVEEKKANFTSTLYYKGNTILKREIVFNYDENSSETLFTLLTVENGNEKYYEYTVDGYRTVTYKDEVTVNKNIETHSISTESVYTRYNWNDYDYTNYLSESTSETVEETTNLCKIIIDRTNKNNIIINILPYEGDEWRTDININSNGNRAGINAKLSLKNEEVGNIDITANYLAEEGVKIQKKNINKSDEVLINNISRDELNVIGETMLENITNFMETLSAKFSI